MQLQKLKLKINRRRVEERGYFKTFQIESEKSCYPLPSLEVDET